MTGDKRGKCLNGDKGGKMYDRKLNEDSPNTKLVLKQGCRLEGAKYSGQMLRVVPFSLFFLDCLYAPEGVVQSNGQTCQPKNSKGR